MIEHINGPHGEPDVALRVHVIERHPPRFHGIAHVDLLVDHHEHLRERHQPLPPQRVHDLVRVSRIFLVDGHEHEVMKPALGRHVVVDDFGRGELEQRQEDALGGVTEIEVFHGRSADDRCGVDRLLAHRHRGDVHLRIQIGFGVEPRVIAERPFDDERIGRIDVAFDHELRVSGHFKIVGDRLGQPHRILAQEAGEEKLVDVGRERRAGGIHAGRITADDDADRHFLAALRHLPHMLRTGFMPLPVHRNGALVDLLHAIHADVANTTRRILADDGGHGEIRAAILGPAMEDRDLVEIDLVTAPHNLLTRRRPALHARRELGDLQQAGQQRQLPKEPIGHLEVHELRNPRTDGIEVIHPQRHGHPPHGTEQVDGDGKF